MPRAESVLDGKLAAQAALDQFNRSEYYLPSRRFLLGALTHYEGPDKWAYEITPYDTSDAKMIADAFRSSAERASKLAGYYRRAEDYVLQANLATSELEQYGRQIIAALMREQNAKRDFENHKKQIEDAGGTVELK